MGRLTESEEAQRQALDALCNELADLATRSDAGLDWPRLAHALLELDAWNITDSPECDPIWEAAELAGEG